MKFFNDNLRIRVIINFMIRYVMILLIPFILFSMIYINSVKIIENDIISSNINMLEKTREILEDRISELDSIAEQVSWNTKIIRYMNVNQPFEGANTYRTLETCSELYNYSLTHNLIYDYYVIYLNSGILIGPNKVYRIAPFYKNFFSYKGVDYDTWYKEISSSYNRGTFIPERQAYFKDKRHNLITYIRDLSGTSRGRSCKIMFLLKADEIRKLLEGFDSIDCGWAYIADETGQVLSSYPLNLERFSHNQELDIEENGYRIQDYENQKTIFTYVVSSNTGWRYVVAQPYENVMQKVLSIKYIGYSVFALALIIGMLLAYIWSNKYSHSIIKTFDLFPQNKIRYELKKDPYEFIQNSIYEVIEDYELLRDTVDQQITFLRNSFFQQLINGDFSNESNLKVAAGNIGIELDGAAYGACLVQLLGYGHGTDSTDKEILKELNIRRMQVRETLLKYRFTKGYIHEISREHLLVIFVMDDADFNLYRREADKYTKSVRNEVKSLYSIEVRFALDQIYNSAMDLTNSIQKELHILNQAQISEINSPYLWCHEIIVQETGFYYPRDVENRLINFTKDGNYERVSEILKQLEINNLIRRRLSPNMLRMFIYQLYGTLIRISQDLSIDNEEFYKLSDTIHTRGDINISYEEIFDHINGYFICLCEMVNERKQNQNIKLMLEIEEYLKSNFEDRNLSLGMLAEKFNYSPAYLSLFFKEQFGSNFSTYLEEIRMAEAMRLLRECHRSIEKIAYEVGYNSPNSFSRAFKRKFGITPGQYRQLNRV